MQRGWERVVVRYPLIALVAQGRLSQREAGEELGLSVRQGRRPRHSRKTGAVLYSYATMRTATQIMTGALTTPCPDRAREAGLQPRRARSPSATEHVVLACPPSPYTTGDRPPAVRCAPLAS